MRLIDADFVIEHIKPYEPSDERWSVTGGTAIRLIHNAIDNAPTVDAVPVTRCRNCEYYKNHPNGLCYLHTEPKENERGYSGEAFCVEPDDFCSYGKPKEDNKCDMVWM